MYKNFVTGTLHGESVIGLVLIWSGFKSYSNSSKIHSKLHKFIETLQVLRNVF